MLTDIHISECMLATIDPREVVRFLHDHVDLHNYEIAHAIGASEFTIKRWRSASWQGNPRQPHLTALDNLRAIVALLLHSGCSLSAVAAFLRSRNPSLGHQRPIDIVGRDSDAEFARVRCAAEEMARA